MKSIIEAIKSVFVKRHSDSGVKDKTTPLYARGQKLDQLKQSMILAINTLTLARQSAIHHGDSNLDKQCSKAYLELRKAYLELR